MFEKVWEEQGFVWRNDRWESDAFPWIIGTAANSTGSLSIRGFMGRPRKVNDPVVLRETITQYKTCRQLKQQYRFAEKTLTEICDELNGHYPNAEFSFEAGNNGTPLITLRFPKSELSFVFTNYSAFMPFVHDKRSKNFSMSYVEIAEAYMAESSSKDDPVVKCTASTINIFVDKNKLRNSDLWKIHNVIEVKEHEIIAEFPKCPPLLAPEFADKLMHTYIEFVCARKG